MRCRGLDLQEYQDVLKCLGGSRDRLLFVFGCKTGLRISELLSITVEQVADFGVVVPQPTQYCYRTETGYVPFTVKDAITVTTKGRKRRSVVLSADLMNVIAWHIKQSAYQSGWLFPSYRPNGPAGKALSRQWAHEVLKEAFLRANLRPRPGTTTATHTMRKTFANAVYLKLDKDIVKTAKALGHENPMDTMAYLEILQKEIDDAILSM